MIITITGRPGAGKTEVSRILEKMGFKIIEMGAVVREEMKKEGIELTPKNAKEFMLKIRKIHGNDVIAKKVTEKALSSLDENLAIVGVRSVTELEYFRKNIKELKTLAILSPQETRFQRLNVRGRADDPKTISEFINYRESNETEVGIDGAIQSSEYNVENSGTFDDLEKNIFLALEQMEHSKTF